MTSWTSLDLLTQMLQTMHQDSSIFAIHHAASPWQASFGEENECGFHLMLQGHCKLITKDNVVIPLGLGDLVLPGGSHQLLLDEEHQEIRMMCGAYTFEEEPFWHKSFPPLIHIKAQAMQPGLKALIELLQHEILFAPPGTTSVRKQLIDTMVIHALRHWITHDSTSCHKSWLGALGHTQISQALAQIHQDLTHPWSLDELAKNVGMSRASFARHFNQRLGVSPIAYLTRARMELAHKKLRATSDSLEEIAQAVGYANTFALSKAFKRTFGYPPSHAREVSTLLA